MKPVTFSHAVQYGTVTWADPLPLVGGYEYLRVLVLGLQVCKSPSLAGCEEDRKKLEIRPIPLTRTIRIISQPGEDCKPAWQAVHFSRIKYWHAYCTDFLSSSSASFHQAFVLGLLFTRHFCPLRTVSPPYEYAVSVPRHKSRIVVQRVWRGQKRCRLRHSGGEMPQATRFCVTLLLRTKYGTSSSRLS